MPLTVLDVLHDPVFRKCDPIVAAGDGALSNPVRWAYTHERFDVVQFLLGGEFLIIEGSVLAEHNDAASLRAYVDSLAQAGVSGLAIELVDFFTSVPQPLADEGEKRGIPIIGLRKRQPFVTLCQAINTRITQEQLLAHMAVDNVMTRLNAQLSRAQSAQDIAIALSDITGGKALIIDSEGTTRAHAENAARASVLPPSARASATFDIAQDGFTVAIVAISHSITPLGAEVQHQMSASLSRVLPAFMPLTIRIKMTQRLLKGGINGITASQQEAADATSMMQALGIAPEARCIPFALEIKDFVNNPSRLSPVVDELRSHCLLQCDSAGIIGVRIMQTSATGTASAAGAVLAANPSAPHPMPWTSSSRFQALLDARDIRIIAGHPIRGGEDMLNAMAALRFAMRQAWPSWGTATPLDAYAYRRLVAQTDVRSAIAAFVAQSSTWLLTADDTCLDTLCALHDCRESKSTACTMLGTSRQTLYSRLERISMVTGIPQSDARAWALLEEGAELVRAMHETGHKPSA